MSDQSKRTFIASPACYAVLYPALVVAAREKGYALAVHGSMVRDFDLIAVPWAPEAAPDIELIHALKAVCSGVFCSAEWDDLVPGGNPSEKPHGRKAWSLHLTEKGCEGPYLDVSVMPRDFPDPQQGAEDLRHY